MRACWEKGLKDFIEECNADIICLQETKLQNEFEEMKNNGYYCYYAFSERREYSGTACFCKEKPMTVTYGIRDDKFDFEGRVITLEYEKYIIKIV